MNLELITHLLSTSEIGSTFTHTAQSPVYTSCHSWVTNANGLDTDVSSRWSRPSDRRFRGSYPGPVSSEFQATFSMIASRAPLDSVGRETSENGTSTSIKRVVLGFVKARYHCQWIYVLWGGLSSATVVVVTTLTFLSANNRLGNVTNRRVETAMRKPESCRSKQQKTWCLLVWSYYSRMAELNDPEGVSLETMSGVRSEKKKWGSLLELVRWFELKSVEFRHPNFSTQSRQLIPERTSVQTTHVLMETPHVFQLCGIRLADSGGTSVEILSDP
ncbi:hypothetical protein H4582DRAFT_2056411 [Lactarius indigo]|nr:hypothetical protein H4582DRAFT_2056411 [Lactarius indigo]